MYTIYNKFFFKYYFHRSRKEIRMATLKSEHAPTINVKLDEFNYWLVNNNDKHQV